MEESRLIFLFEERQVEFRSVLEVSPEILIAFDVHDRVDRPGFRRRRRLSARHFTISYY
jgi:hypothetical protein